MIIEIRKFKNRKREFYSKVRNTGIKTDYSYSLVRRIRMVNTIGFWASFTWIIFAFVLYYFGFYIACIINILSSALCVTTIYLNKIHRHNSSFYLFNIWMLAGILVLTLTYGRDSGTQYVLLPWFATSTFLFKHTKQSAPLFILGLISFVGIEFFHTKYAYLDTTTIPNMQWIMAGMNVVFLKLIIEYFKKDSSRYQYLIKSKNKELEYQKDEIIIQKELLESQNEEIEQHNYNLNLALTQIKSSVNYARRIQKAILLPEEEIMKSIGSLFIINKPKDIVSGDFYWFHKKNNKIIIAVADCTGHGVPGALMTAIGNTLLNQIIDDIEEIKPSIILHELQIRLVQTLHQNFHGDDVKDGMDISVCVIEEDKSKLTFAGAKRPLYLFRNSELLEFKGELISIGAKSANNIQFNDNIIELKKNDRFYMFSDGYADQLGGNPRRKMKLSTFKQKLIDIQSINIKHHKKELESFLNYWQQNYDQIDDIIILGFEI